MSEHHADLLERAAELSQLDALLAGTSAGDGGAILIEGPPGMGKTSLLAEARRRAAAAEIQTLTAFGAGVTANIPFGLARELLEPALASLSDAERTAALSGAAALAAPAIGMGQGPAPGPTSRPSRPGAAASARLYGLYWLTVALAASRPLMLSVDDAHLGDAASLGYLAYLLPRLDGLPVAVIAAAHSRAAAAAPDAFAAVRSHPRTRILSLAPLSAAASLELLRARLGPDVSDEAGRAGHEATAGNPLLLSELAGALEAAGSSDGPASAAAISEIRPAMIARSALARLGAASADARRVASAVAVLGSGAALSHAAALAGIPAPAAEDAADELARLDVLLPGRPLAFAHPIVQSGVYADLAAGRRSRAHGDAARILRAGGASADLVAAHLVLTTPAGNGEVVDALRDAAERALVAGAPSSAADCLRRALAEPPPPELLPVVLTELGAAEAREGSASAVGRLVEALSVADGALHGAAAAELGRVLLRLGRIRQGVSVLEQAIEQLSGDPRLALRLEAELIDTLRVDVTHRPLLQQRLELFRVRAEQAGGPQERRLLLAALAFESALAGGPAREAGDLAERALVEGRLLEGRTSDSAAVFAAIYVLIVCDRFDLAERHLDSALRDARERGSVRAYASAQHFRAVLAYKQGAIRRAEALAGAALDAVRQHGGDLIEPALVAGVVDALLARGEYNAAEERMAEAPPDQDGNVFFSPLAFSRARLRALQGEPEEAATNLLGCGERVESWGGRNPSIFPWRSSAAPLLVRLGRRTEGRRLAAEELRMARRFGASRALGVALIAAGRVDGGPRGLELLHEACETLESSGALLEHARAVAALGTALRRARRRAAARQPLRLALQLAEECGATVLAKRVEQELAATGARYRRRPLSGVDALTPRELSIVGMAAEGMANRDIAQALFVTPKTVEVHLTRSYRKLGITSRQELPHVLAGERSERIAELSSAAAARAL